MKIVALVEVASSVGYVVGVGGVVSGLCRW